MKERGGKKGRRKKREKKEKDKEGKRGKREGGRGVRREEGEKEEGKKGGGKRRKRKRKKEREKFIWGHLPYNFSSSVVNNSNNISARRFVSLKLNRSLTDFHHDIKRLDCFV